MHKFYFVSNKKYRKILNILTIKNTGQNYLTKKNQNKSQKQTGSSSNKGIKKSLFTTGQW